MKKQKNRFRVRHEKIGLGAHTVRLLILSPLNQSKEKVPGVLWIHGGGYQAGHASNVFLTRALSLVVKRNRL
jgi:carboxylesterase type B